MGQRFRGPPFCNCLILEVPPWKKGCIIQGTSQVGWSCIYFLPPFLGGGVCPLEAHVFGWIPLLCTCDGVRGERIKTKRGQGDLERIGCGRCVGFRWDDETLHTHTQLRT